ncbi:MAG: homoserine kinase [Actinomycetota bacterium]|nr:homoserine kinase [Actinomycetota bacterium]
MAFSQRPVRVRVPATSANLGPGYDAFGLALGRYDEVTAAVTGSGLQVTVSGCGDGQVSLDERHLVVRSMRAAFDRLGGQPAGLRIDCLNRIPHGRGLGSSAAAIVSGILAARALTVDGTDLLAEPLALATELEGHPDNVAACLLGEFTVAWLADGVGRAVTLTTRGAHPVLFIPTEQSATHAARAALPATVPHADAAFNLSRSALLVLALTGRPDLLLTATEDRLHQDYRAAGMPASSALVATLRQAGIAAVISGAGSSVLALAASTEQLAAAQLHCPPGWECAPLPIAAGAEVSPA